MKTLAKLKSECAALDIYVGSEGRTSKESFVVALRNFFWNRDHPGEPMPPQIEPMLLSDWNDLTAQQREEIEQDHHAWIAQPKLDGVRALLHVENGRVRLSSRVISEVTYRLSEFQDNVPHLHEGLSSLDGSILDGELVCPISKVNTGGCQTDHPLQAATAILATSPDNARQIQDRHDARLRFHVFDILKFGGVDVTPRPLYERQAVLSRALDQLSNRFLEMVPSVVVGKADFHRRILEAGGEGTVLKKADETYQPGKRVRHSIKHKRGLEVEAFVTDFKPGTVDAGNANAVGALEFSILKPDGTTEPIAWVSTFSKFERAAMTQHDSTGRVVLHRSFQRRRAVIAGQDLSVRSKRLRHAKVRRWLDA